MTNSIKRKINIFGKVGKIITLVLIILLWVFEGLLLTGEAILIFVPKDAVTVEMTGNAQINIRTGDLNIDKEQLDEFSKNSKVTINDREYSDIKIETDKEGMTHITTENQSVTYDIFSLMSVIGVLMIKLAAFIVALFFFKALMKSFSTCDTPFCDEIVKKLRNFAFSLIPTIAVSAGMNVLLSSFSNGSIDIGSSEIPAAFFVIIILILSLIFKYGTELQKEHDETV